MFSIFNDFLNVLIHYRFFYYIKSMFKNFLRHVIIVSLKKIIILVLICLFTVSLSVHAESEKDDVFLIDDTPFGVHKSRIEEIKKTKAEYDEYGFSLKESIVEILPKDEECANLRRPIYLLDDVTTKYFEKGPLDSFHAGLYYKGTINTNIFQGGGNTVDYNTNNIENHFRGYFKDGKTSFKVSTRYTPRKNLDFFQFLIGDLFISHQLNPHHRIVLGNSRTHTGEEGSKPDWMVPFISYSQIGRNIGNVRKFGARVIGEYDLIEYDLGGYSSDSYFREFFPGAEFTGWVNLKPLGKTNGKYGDLKIGGGISSGHNGFTYNVAGAYARYQYKKFKADFEFSNADGYNGNLGLSQNHARGMYSSVYYRVHPKVELMARYDTFQPNLNVSNDDIKEYVVGLNYYVKGQGLRFMLNYIFRQNSFDADSHRIIFGTQIML